MQTTLSLAVQINGPAFRVCWCDTPIWRNSFSLLQIDALSKRSKEAEAAFLNVYKKIIDVPGNSIGIGVNVCLLACSFKNMTPS